MSAERHCDVAIVGGGLVGASLALALSKTPFRVALIEAAPPPAGAPSWDERCIALNAASQQIFSSLGLWEAFAPAAEPILRTHISERGRFGVARFAAQEAGLPALGYNVSVRELGQQLWRALQQTHTQIVCPAAVEAIEVDGEGVRLDILLEQPPMAQQFGPVAPDRSQAGKDSHSRQSVKARLAVAADGAHSAVRKLLGLEAETRDYGQSAIVTAVRSTRPHRGCAYERFTPEGPIAVLPKHADVATQTCSLVWTVATARVEEMLAWPDRAFLRQANDAFGERLGRFTELGKRSAFPLARVMSERLSAPRVLFAGNAAQSLHPVAAQGFNLGLRDVATVAELLRDAADPGAPELLAEYERRRARDRELVSGFTDRLVRLFSNRIPGLSALRHLGLLALDLAPPVKQAVMWQNLGYAAAPAAARSSST